VNGEIAKRVGKKSKYIGPFGVSVGQAQPKVGFVTTAKQDITSVKVCRHIVRVPEQVRERTFNNSHGQTISEQVQMLLVNSRREGEIGPPLAPTLHR
jgi:hypothetical protein